jgi:uncharacterized membrane protein
MTTILQNVVDYGGRLHPLCIHFPIAFLIVGAVGECVRLRWVDQVIGRYVAWMMIIGAAGAVSAAATGWLFGIQIHPPMEMHRYLAWHRWMGTLVSITSVGAAYCAWRLADSQHGGAIWLRRCLIWGNALLLGIAAHVGAVLVWGDDFFS